MSVRFRLMGPLRVLYEGQTITPSAPKVMTVLALLLLRANRVVKSSELIDELWGHNPPATALITLQGYISRLRKMFTSRVTDGSVSLNTEPSGYVIVVQPEQIDLYEFESLAVRGRDALEDGDFAAAAELCARAMQLWDGPPLADVRPGDLLSAHLVRLEESRIRVIETGIEARLRAGEHRAVISELMELARTHPLHEGIRQQLMLALYRSGRRFEAVAEYERLRRLLRDELGLDPSVRLRTMYQALLVDDQAVLVTPTPPAPAAARSARTAPPVPASGQFGSPAQLPPDTADFVGRREEVERAIAWLREAADSTATRVLLITGMPGVGKTTLAVHIAHRLRTEFPDGQLYADLQGRRDQPFELLGGFLRGIGMASAELPDGVQERSALFRTWSSRHRALTLLDDATSAQQVRQLLPSGDNCAVIVTSARELTEIPGAQVLRLQPLDLDDGVELLIRLLGDDGETDVRRDAARVADLFGCLPLAIRCIGARMHAVQGGRLISKLRAMLDIHCGGQVSLSELRFGDLDVQSRFDSSYGELGELDREVFALFGTDERAVLTAADVQAALGASTAGCAAALDTLVRNNLLTVADQQCRFEPSYRMHPLLRAFARAKVEGDRPQRGRSSDSRRAGPSRHSAAAG